jgi:hypothetical protein
VAQLLILLLSAAAAQAPQAPVTNPDITVTGDNRVICRRVIHTETRMGTGRRCRTLAQWRHEAGEDSDDNANATVDGAADSLQQVDQRISTGDTGGELTVENGHGMNGRTPLGPR